MNLVKMTCSNCNANLKIDLDNLQAYCPYCGEKLMIDVEDLGELLKEKEKTKRTINKEMHRTNRMKLEKEYEEKAKDKDWRKTIIGTVFAVIVLGVIFISLDRDLDSSRKRHNEKVEYLQQLEIEIEEDIKNGDYDSALLKAYKLYCDGGWSSDEEKAWDEKRKAYIELIEEKKRETGVLERTWSTVIMFNEAG